MKDSLLLEQPLVTDKTPFRPFPFFRSSSGLLWTCLFFVWIADLFFYKQPVGWTFAAFLGLLTAGVMAFQTRPLKKQEYFLLLSLTGLLFALLEEPGILAIFLSAIALLSFTLSPSTPPANWPRYWIRFAFGWWLRPLSDWLLYRKWRRSGHGHQIVSRLTHSAAVWVLPVLFSLVFVWLFSIANPLISRWMAHFEEQVLTLIARLDLTFSRIFFWLMVASFCWALLRFRNNNKKRQFEKTKSVSESDRFNPDLIVRCLTLFNLVFAVQSGLDVLYLWGGKALPQGMTYAEYAHRGAYPLIFTALLAAVFVLVTFRKNGVSERIAWARHLVFLWIAQNVFLTISSLWRLHIYVEAYSLTRLRIAAAIWMFLVAIGLVWIAARILLKQSNGWLVRNNVLTLIFVLYICSFLNFDGAIAWHNVRNSREVTGKGPSVDLSYLRHLGPESIPALLWLSEQKKGLSSFEASVHAEKLQQALRRQLENWRGWTFRRHRLQNR